MKLMSPLPTYGFCIIVSASLVVLLSMSTDFFVAYVNDILAPCQHDSVYRDGECICNNRVFSGEYCEECQCKHFGVCSITENSSSRWGCRCPSHQKWVGTLCDQCYSKHRTEEVCRGDCVEVEGVYKHYGPKCNTVCMPYASKSSKHCREVTAGGGTCNACNEHGTCTSTGQCKCDEGYFTSRGGEQCSVTCDNCPPERGRCLSIGGQLTCACEEGWYGPNCRESCILPEGNGLPCSGHGTCGYNGQNELKCTCSTHWIGDYCEQKCPGNETFPTTCSGHGQCISTSDGATCDCVAPWEGADCSCSATYTCSGHGVCADDATCECFDESIGSLEAHFSGKFCERCKEHWYGTGCHLRCEESMEYSVASDTIGLNVGCNGHGSCQLEVGTNSESVTCVCDGTDPDTFCATCKADYYPFLNISDVSVPHCSVACERGTCSQHGECNPNYNGRNQLCLCDVYSVPGTNITLDTIDAEQNCATCRKNWYPTAMDTPERCTKYCAADGEINSQTNQIQFLTDSSVSNDLQGDADAQSICVNENGAYKTDADCRVCSGQGSCFADGTCKCSEKTTGDYCNIQCGGANEAACSNHGRCVRNDLELWFNPYTTNYRCECLPYDTYTSETRQRLIKQGFQVEPPPSPNYYGQFCEFHCPRYNEDICAGRGDCKTGIVTDDEGYVVTCNTDANCEHLPGAFCARLTSPWDSLMTSGKSFFSSGPDSPGYYSCSTSTNCIDSIYSIKWDEFCVNMLHGWYPPVLNTAECAYSGNCRNHIETFFMESYKDNKTWCEAAMEELSAPKTCGATSYANEVTFLTENVPVCLEYTLDSTCNAQKQCIYDQTLNHIKSVDDECSLQSLPCTGPCQRTGNNTCETKTYCRAKTCQDVILEKPIERLCNVDAPCSAEVDWADFCANAVGNIHNVSSEMNSMETFYNCHMYRKRYNPQIVEKTTQIPLQGVLNIFGEDVSIASLRTSFVDTLVNAGEECNLMDFTSTDFCTKHLERLVPFGYSAETPKDGWFLPWIVECPEGPDSVWSSEAEAYIRISQVSLECKAHKRNSVVEGQNEWEDLPSHADTNIYTELKKWSLDCPGQTVVTMDSVEYSYDGTNDNALSCHTDRGWFKCSEVSSNLVNAWSPWPLNPRGCRLKENTLAQRWGSSGWSPADVQREFTASCLEGLAAPWMPLSKPLPTLCDLGACHPEDECILCSDPMATCDVSASVQCKASQSFFYRDDNRCQKNGTIWHPFPTRSRTYFCDWLPVAYKNVSIEGQTFKGELNSRGILTVFDGSINKNASVIVDTVAKTIESFRTHQDKISMVWTDTSELPEADSETYISSLQNCNSNFNWFEFCAESNTGTLLDLNPSFGLKSGWSGDAVLLREGELTFTKATYQSSVSQTNLVVTTQNRVRITCGNVTTEGTGQLSVPGPFQECQLTAVYPPAIISSVMVSSEQQIQSFKETLEGHPTRQFNFVKDNYKDWAFSGDNTVYKHSFDLDSRNRGIRFDLGQQHENMRMTGWFKTSDDTGEIMSMRLSTEEDTDIITLYVYGNALYYKNGDKTENNGDKICNVPAKEWVYWSIQVDHLSDTEHEAFEHKVWPDGASYYVQEWQLHVSVETSSEGRKNWSGMKSTESSIRLRRHHMKSAESFHDIEDQDSQECAHHCLHHDDCQQWSWTHEDRHCYLHRARCHEDSGCMHGRHLMNSHESHKVSHFELYSARARESSPLPTYWKHIRAEPIIESPTCETINTSSIHPRWRAAFEALYEPFEPDATRTCNDLVDAWTLMPDYVSKVCYGNNCNYSGSDLKACGDHLDTLYPSNVPADCDSVKFLKTNWSAYCHYLTSFEGVQTDVGTEKRIPFLGGLALNWNGTCQEAWSVYEDGEQACPGIDFTWFRNCFERSSEYEEFCSSRCLSSIDEMLSNGNSEGICSIRQEYLNIATDAVGNTNDIGQNCNCNIDNVIISDFCLMQNAYHEGASVNIPELHHSECSSGCRETLKNSLNRSDWRQWCFNLSDNKISGTCSKTTCECNQQENIGVAGERCELSCPSGISNGEELACSGRNGRCFAVDPSELVSDTLKQQSAKETRPGTIGPLVPEWVSGPSPTMTGRCQCVLGSGDACSIPCFKCNNGTYGYHMASQYGICDSFNGICRALPSFMRYNTKNVQIEVSYNTTAFESMLGVYRWEHPGRFLFEDDETLLMQALRENQKFPVTPKSVNTSDLKLNENIETMLGVFNDYCWSNQTDEPYLNNSAGIQFLGKTIDVNQTIVLKEIDEPSWGQCTKIQVSEAWYFCFANGVLNAYDNSTSKPLLVRHNGISQIPKAKMSFVKRDDATIYAYGGEYPYPKTTETFDDMYKIKFYRRSWNPYDIVFTNWELVRPAGDVHPPSATFAPIFSYYDELYLLTTLNNEHTLYRLKYETVSVPAEWSKLGAFTFESSVVNIVGNANKQISVYFENDEVKTMSNESVWTRGVFVHRLPAVDALSFGYSSGQKMSCRLEMFPNELRVGGLTIASYAVSALQAFVFLEEWLTIDILSEANTRLRVQNAIQWQVKTENMVATRSQALVSLDAVTRIHMHQARWYAYRDILVRYELSNRINIQMVHYVVAPEPSDTFLDYFSSIQPVFFESAPLSNPSHFAVRWEGETFERCLVIFGNYGNGVYEQDIDFESDRLQLRVSWTKNSFQLRLKNSESQIQWYKNGHYKAFTLVLHLEEWVYNKIEPFQAKYTTQGSTGHAALFQLFLVEESMPTYNMQLQTASFLQYTPSHCALTGDVECPGLLPFTKLPCSGRGRCSFSCQCTCEVAKSVLESSETALLSVQWTDSPWRGSGCEITCPGYDGYSKDSICSNNGQCQRDGRCSCNQGYTGDACQFKCPVNEKNETCSLHGGCGTRAYDMNSFPSTDDAYLDALSAKNIEHYKKSLLEYYGQCNLENFIEQQSSFGQMVKNHYPAAFTLEAGKQLCSDINSDVNSAKCVGIRKEQEAINSAGAELQFSEIKYVPVVLRDILTEYTTIENIEQFDCQNADCSIQVSESDDSTLMGIKFKLNSPEFTFVLHYVHGNSKGRQTFLVNDETFIIELDWTPEHCVVLMGVSVVVNVSYPVERIILNIEDNVFTKKIFPFYIPRVTTNETIWIAPDYTQKYRIMLRSNLENGYYYNVPSSIADEVRPLLTRLDAEKECDAEVACRGILRWHVFKDETLYSLYTEELSIEGYQLKEIPALEFDFLNKMSLTYQGKETADGLCSVVEPGMAKYPSVSFTEEYNIPIQNADLSLAKDEDTGAINVGDGIWTRCWTRKPDITTKVGCYEEAKKHNYGFAFSDQTKLCLIYTGITDPNKIRLDKYNSKTRLTKNNPCEQQSQTRWFT